MKIICIGLNYKSHIEELKKTIPAVPVFFLKPESALTRRNRPFFHPDFSDNIHYEVELVVRINKLGKYIQKKFAHTYYDEIGLGIDFTARDIQAEVFKNALPWEISKAFDGSAVINRFLPKNCFKDLKNINFSLFKNKQLVQQGNTSDMLFSIDEIIEYVSQFITLKIGDLIFTGTPCGVGKVEIGDELEGYIEEELMFKCRVK
ncbi:MAG: fumarylacetoacetate hydrolase family protein [Bacteroidetes bacterium]|nr:fumarylacetoacetate hydrolase family protein [Bacteroidota bacterium]MCL1968893.1 fumarylacetoacetate hydrolase family protein [Bacteroidota bacterium]MCL1969008.1 fumarylacetoacetate hydrolase family protein [Bacteroidota bacterium]